jgi:hypothetical protein
MFSVTAVSTVTPMDARNAHQKSLSDVFVVRQSGLPMPGMTHLESLEHS